MEPLALYLLKSCALIALFYTAYFVFLRKETFFRSNRWYLLLGLVTSVLLPLVTYKKIVWIDPLPRSIDWNNVPAEFYGPVQQAAAPQGFEINWFLVLAVVYLLGISTFVVGFLLDFYSLRKVMKGKKVLQQADFRFVDTTEKVAPFSYFNYIVYNSSLYSEAELANIIEHEKVHSSQNHTADVLFARFFCIVFWFNPFVWLYKKAMLQNLEFIADSEATKNIADKKSYQITLLKVTAHENCVDITNHFYQSLIKKRIVMLNKNQSKKISSWKYFLIIPALAAFMFYFQVKVIAQEKASPLIVGKTLLQNGTEVVVDKNTTDAELKQQCEKVKKEHGVTLKFSKVKRNSNGEITAIKATYKDANGKKGATQVSGEEPIQPIRFYKNNDAIGFGNGRGRGVRVYNYAGTPQPGNFEFNSDGDDFVVELPEMPEIPDFEAPELPEPPEAPEAPETMKADTLFWSKGKNNHVIIKNRNGKSTVIVDGKVVSDVDVDKILADVGPIIVNGEDVLKKGRTYTYSSGKNGRAIVIDTQKITAEAMEKAQAAMEKARPQMEKAKEQMSKMRAEMDKQREARRDGQNQRDQEMKQAREEIEQARKDIEQARAEIEKTRAEMKAEMEKQKAANGK